MRIRTIVVLLTVFHPVSWCLAQTVDQEKEAIAAVIRTAYIGGAYNDADSSAIGRGFHERATVQELHGASLQVSSLAQWRIGLDRQRMLGLKSRLRTSVDIRVIGLSGRAAVAQVDSSNDGVHDLTDFLSLYKVPDGWRITNRIATRPALPSEVQRQRMADAEVSVTTALQPPDRVLDAIGVKPGMVIGEIGAGGGRYTVHLARRVGRTGKVYANDIDRSAVTSLGDRLRREGLANIEPILGAPDDPRFPARSLDLAFMVWVYHHLDPAPVTLLKRIRESLKPGALLVMIEPVDSELTTELVFAGERPAANRPATIIEKIKKEGGEAGFELLRVETFLPLDYICILRAATPGR